MRNTKKNEMFKYLSESFLRMKEWVASSRLYKAAQPYLEKTSTWFSSLPKKRVRLGMWLGVGIILLSEIATLLQPYLIQHTYVLGNAASLLPVASPVMAAKLKYDTKQQVFDFNNGQALPSDNNARTGGEQVSARAYKDASKGLIVTDPLNKIDFKLTPDFDLLPGQKEDNRVVYPLRNGTGWAVYTMQGIGVKEDILLQSASGDKADFDYALELGDSLDARLEVDGSIGVYGNTLLSSNIATGSDKDAELLQKARQNAAKDTLLFRIPRPVVIESGKDSSDVRASFSLSGNKLTVTASGLKKASYPLTIDPTIYVTTAEQFMAGNNETNIDFDVANQLIKKGRTTGARFDSWDTTMSLPSTSWKGGTAAAGGYVYNVGGGSFSGQVFSTQGTSTFTVPPGVTSITVKAWGGGGGGGSGGTSTTGGAGAGGGYVTAGLSTTPGESLNIYVGGGGGPGTKSTSSGGGGGGGHSSVYRSSTALVIAAGGGGGGGGRNSAGADGAVGGAGGGTTGVNGASSGAIGGGTGGTPSTGGTGGVGSATCDGANGASLAGGAGGRRAASCETGGGGAGGLATGGAGGNYYTGVANNAGGGGGGSGYFGGGGGGSSATGTQGGGGGGGGSSYTVTGASSVTNTAGSGTSPGNSGDADRNGASDGGAGGATDATGSTGDNGIVIVTYSGGANLAASSSVRWAKFNTTDGAVESANPGNGACSGWCTESAYDLPAARASFSLVAYNGFLYAMGGQDASGNRQSTVYVAKIGANGEPQLWHPSDTNTNNWVYWYHDDTGMALSSTRSSATAIAYNNRMYFMGGVTGSGAGTVVNTVEIADILPNGKLGSWTTSGVNLPTARYGHSAQVYNDRLYLIGGATSVGGAPTTSVHYTKINSDGSLYSWISTTSLTTGRMNNGGNFSAIWGGYLYLSGGCSAVNGSGYCSTVRSDTQVASINAEGSLGTWSDVAGVSTQRSGAGLIAWRDHIYAVGGCQEYNLTNGDCNTPLTSIVHGTINQEGDGSVVGTTVASGTAPCSGASPTSCELPNSANIGNLHAAAVITNGYLYVIGGCTGNGCAVTSTNVVYVSISSTGTMSKPAVCTGGTYVNTGWCKSPNTISGGVAGTTPVVFGGRIYLVGGFTGTGNTNSIVRTTINQDGSISSFSSQSLSGGGSVGATSVAFAYAFARANPTAASSDPGNLYILGGCTTTSSADCTAYTGNVYKCNIATAGAVGSCSTTSQLQIGVIPGSTNPGLAIMSGTVYAGYVYLIGGSTPDQQDINSVRYAKIDNSNNIVTVGSGWTQASDTMNVSRRRAAAFGYNGYLYVVGGYDGVSPQGVIEFIKINTTDGSLSGVGGKFIESEVSITQRWGLTVPVSNSFAYVIGGCTAGASPGSCTARTDTIQTLQLYNNDSGAPASYIQGNVTGLPDLLGGSATIYNGYIYHAGGCTNMNCTGMTAKVYYASINADGTLGNWLDASANSGTDMPAALAMGKLLAAGGSLYYVGGQTGQPASTSVSTVYYTTGITSGSPTWNATATTRGLGDSGAGAVARTQFGAAVWNDRLYVVGGYTNNSTVQSSVLVSPAMTAGGNITAVWSTSSTSFNIARAGLSAVAYANNLYMLGGNDGNTYMSDVQYAKIDSATGNITGSWSYSTSLPGPLSQANAFAANGYIYLVGGRSASSVCDPITLVAPISANTALPANNPTGVGEWFETNQRYVGSRYGSSLVYNDDGKMYVIGGGCSSLVTGADKVYSTALLTQPQVAKYSIMIDTDTDVFPTHWLLNGIDNSIGANWKLKYRSMTNPGAAIQCASSGVMSTWGQETNFGNVSLGLPGVYTPKDGSGTNTNCARYFYFNVTVDSSRTFGYPDDVTRGPTITDLTLNFTSNPAKRLMHGRTFTGGLQQPIDTPYYSN